MEVTLNDKVELVSVNASGCTLSVISGAFRPLDHEKKGFCTIQSENLKIIFVEICSVQSEKRSVICRLVTTKTIEVALQDFVQADP